MPLLTREQIFQVQDLSSEIVAVPEWGGEVRVQALNGTNRDKFEAAQIEFRGKERRVRLFNVRARLAALTIVDDNGNRIFTDEDVARLGSKNSAALDRVCTVAQRLSGLSDQDVDDIAKNSESALPGDSYSG